MRTAAKAGSIIHAPVRLMKPHSLLSASAAHARSPTKAVGSSEKAGSIAQAPDSLTNPHSPDAASRARHSGPSAAGFCGAAGSGPAPLLPVGGGVSVSSAAVPFARSSSLLIPIAAPAHAMPATASTPHPTATRRDTGLTAAPAVFTEREEATPCTLASDDGRPACTEVPVDARRVGCAARAIASPLRASGIPAPLPSSACQWLMRPRAWSATSRARIAAKAASRDAPEGTDPMPEPFKRASSQLWRRAISSCLAMRSSCRGAMPAHMAFSSGASATFLSCVSDDSSAHFSTYGEAPWCWATAYGVASAYSSYSTLHRA